MRCSPALCAHRAPHCAIVLRTVRLRQRIQPLGVQNDSLFI